MLLPQFSIFFSGFGIKDFPIDLKCYIPIMFDFYICVFLFAHDSWYNLYICFTLRSQIQISLLAYWLLFKFLNWLIILYFIKLIVFCNARTLSLRLWTNNTITIIILYLIVFTPSSKSFLWHRFSQFLKIATVNAIIVRDIKWIFCCFSKRWFLNKCFNMSSMTVSHSWTILLCS